MTLSVWIIILEHFDGRYHLLAREILEAPT